jgi:hypothetical protein
MNVPVDLPGTARRASGAVTEMTDRAAGAAGRAASSAGAWVRRAAPVVGAAVPVALVNGTAFVGQFAWVQSHVPWAVPLQVMFAVTLESVAVYLAWHAHLAQLANDSAARLKMGAYLFALIIGAMNYSHYARHWHPDALAVALGLMSALSPWLWGVHTRRASRDALMAQGLIEPRAVRLGATRWTWHPLRSTQVMYHATWLGENDPQRAIGLYETVLGERAARRAARRGNGNAVPPVAQQPVPEALVPPAAQPPVPLQPTVPAPVPVPAGQPWNVPLPGTQLNGSPVPGAPEVKAIAGLSARPNLGASHPIDPAKITEVELHLAGLAADALPGEREVGKMLCAGHNHRRQGAKLIAARLAAGQDPLPAFVQSQRQPSGPVPIASPVSTLPGGKQANG